VGERIQVRGDTRAIAPLLMQNSIIARRALARA
jgi:hypothetical protein